MKSINLITKLLSIKRVIAFMLTIVFCKMSLNSQVSSQEFLTVFSMVIAFYFGQSVARKDN
ncbi:hypothetical protein [Romboutsia lituseburensis]|uniref:hypothetical protein n=1 Tax=Romboutsia lituseburensis TaxID=1537 RepID=UPI0022EA9B42|nr:hypothetical protein [Romboutsia lituseburensis]